MPYGYPLNFKPQGFPYPNPKSPGENQYPYAVPPNANEDALQGLEMPQLPPSPRPAMNELQLPQPPSRLEQAQEEPVPSRSSGISWTGGKSLGTEEALSGLRGAQDSQFSSFGPMELNRLANRDPDSVQPGSNKIWAGMLGEQNQNHEFQEGLQRKALQGISGAIAETHPAVQFTEEQDARRKSMPAMITGRAQLEAAKVAGQSRMDVGDSALEGRVQSGRYGHLDTIMAAIRANQAKLNRGAQDEQQLVALHNLYDIMAGPLTGATFEEATEDFEQ